MEKPLEIYFVCEHRGPEWVYSMGILSNGMHFGSHLCSHENYAPGDLYFRRKERIAALKEMFGIDPETVKTTLYNVRSKEDTPEWWERLANSEEVQKSLEPYYDRYKKLIGEKEVPTPSATIQMGDDQDEKRTIPETSVANS